MLCDDAFCRILCKRLLFVRYNEMQNSVFFYPFCGILSLIMYFHAAVKEGSIIKWQEQEG